MKNSLYYWGFAAFVAYYINHPLYTKAYYGNVQIYSALAAFIVRHIYIEKVKIRYKNS